MNAGKRFENNWKASIPQDVFYRRLNDAASGFGQSNLRFALQNPYDCEMFYNGHLFCLELKSTKNTSMSFEAEKGSNKSAMIHYHQIIGLANAGVYDGVIAGLILNWRNEKEGTEVTYFQDIAWFEKMIREVEKKSFNQKDLMRYHPILIESVKKKVNYKYDVKSFIEETIRNYKR